MRDEDENWTLVGKVPAKLIPCPKGCKAEILIYHLPDSQSRHLYCKKCKWTAPWGDTYEEAVHEWNTRIASAGLAWNTRSSDARTGAGNCRHGIPICGECQLGEINAHLREKEALRFDASGYVRGLEEIATYCETQRTNFLERERKALAADKEHATYWDGKETAAAEIAAHARALISQHQEGTPLEVKRG